MKTELFWIATPGMGRLAIMPRPRGGDWLEDEVLAWRVAGIDVIVSLLTAAEIADLDLADEASLCQASGILYVSFPIVDRGVPPSKEKARQLVVALATDLAAGNNIAIHCRQGIGRAALIAACILIQTGMPPADAMNRVGTARGCSIPETPEQKRWILDFATQMIAAPSK